MERILKKSILVLGVIIATLVLINDFGYAGTEWIDEKIAEDMNIEQQVVDILVSMEEKESENTLYKIYNDADQLVYQTQNIKDEKLIQLIKTSDFLAEVDKISYYKLSR